MIQLNKLHTPPIYKSKHVLITFLLLSSLQYHLNNAFQIIPSATTKYNKLRHYASSIEAFPTFSKSHHDTNNVTTNSISHTNVRKYNTFMKNLFPSFTQTQFQIYNNIPLPTSSGFTNSVRFFPIYSQSNHHFVNDVPLPTSLGYTNNERFYPNYSQSNHHPINGVPIPTSLGYTNSIRFYPMYSQTNHHPINDIPLPTKNPFAYDSKYIPFHTNFSKDKLMKLNPTSSTHNDITTSINIEPSPSNVNLKPLYSDAELERDRSTLLQLSFEEMVNLSKESKFLIFLGNHGVFYTTNDITTEPLIWSYDDICDVFGDDVIPSLLSDYFTDRSAIADENEEISKSQDDFIVWVGKKDDTNYFSIYLHDDIKKTEYNPTISTIIDKLTTIKSSELSSLYITTDDKPIVKIAPLREFGDLLPSNTASIACTANGYINFHKSNLYCASCGSKTKPAKLGANRKCTDKNRCSPTYPRIDIATIMIITSHDDKYALLGRKKSWPKGRYSTLAGFIEIGETLEESVVRETLEESGVKVDPESIKFVNSMPWPFPRSFMIGFQAKALKSDNGSLPKIIIDEDEMEDIQWFSKEYVRDRLAGGSTALGYEPKAIEEEFHIPGRASLARILITQWALS